MVGAIVGEAMGGQLMTIIDDTPDQLRISLGNPAQCEKCGLGICVGEQLQDAVENQTRIANAFMLCRQPTDEIKQLTEMLDELVVGKRSKILFEPAEPCFELSITNVAGGLRVDFFVDAGNVETGIYRWDALGVRFFTDLPGLESFATELKAQFGC